MIIFISLALTWILHSTDLGEFGGRLFFSGRGLWNLLAFRWWLIFGGFGVHWQWGSISEMTRNTAGIFGRVCSQKRVDRTGCPNSKVPPLKVQVFIQVENSKSNPQEKDVWIIWTKTNSKEHFWIWIKLCICIGTFLVEADAGGSKNSRHMR